MSHGNTAKRKATYEDLLKLPEGVVGEIVGGELYTQPRPGARHALAQRGVVGALVDPFDFGRSGPGGWIILVEPELHLAEDVLVPDVAAWRKERLPNLANETAIQVVPDWVCEILSPSTRRKDRVVKLPAYAHHGVGWVWLMDPATREIEVFVAKEGGWFLVGTFGDVDKVAIPPFSAVELDLALFWPPPPEAE